MVHVFTQRRIWSFRVVVLQRTAKKCTKIYDARAQPLVCSLNLLFSDIPVVVAVVVFLNSLQSDNNKALGKEAHFQGVRGKS